MGAGKLIWGKDLYKGFKLDKNTLLTGGLGDIMPFQMLTQEEKTMDWIKAVADYYDMASWRNIERRAWKMKRNFDMRNAQLNPSDYIVNADENEFAKAVGMVLPPENQSPIEQFYPLVPNFVDVLRGEFIKRENRWTIETIDPYSMDEAFMEKKSMFEEVIMNFAMVEKQQTLAQMGLTPEVDPEQFELAMQEAMKELTEVELKMRNFRSTGAQWAEKVLKIHEKRYRLNELEPDAFEVGLISDAEFWHLDMLEDDFKLELLNPMFCDSHKGPNVKYVSEGDYFSWFDFMSTGDIVNKFGRRMHVDDLEKLKEVYVRTANLIVPDQLKNRQGAYYDETKPWAEATDLNPALNDVNLGYELAYNFMRSPNFDHNIDTDVFTSRHGRMATGAPQMFRVMRLYWRSMRKIGWLTRIMKDGSVMPGEWVDENYIITEEPHYDLSITKEKSKDNLLYGEHIDWTWTTEWRHVIKISPNHRHTFWMDEKNSMKSIYIDGQPIPFQFKGRNTQFDCLPPIEGCYYSYFNARPSSLVDRLRPLQIIYNICMNRVPKKFLEDYGLKVAIDKRSFSLNHLGNRAKSVDPLDAYEEKLRNSPILDYHVSREALEGAGQPALPGVLQLSTVNDAMAYFQLGQQIKMEAGEIIGISRQRLGKNMASDTATSIEQGIAYSETQTEKYFEQHANLMERVRQRMLDATQYFSTFTERTRDIYMNDRDENVFLEIEGTDNLLRHYNIYLQSRANVRSALQTISAFLMNDNTLPVKPSARIEALISNSVPQILQLIREGENEAEKIQREKMEQDQMAHQQQMEQLAQIEQAKLEFEAQQAELDRQTEIEVATIRAMGGLQSDNNQDGQIDSSQNLSEYLKSKQQSDQLRQKQTEAETKANIERQRMLLEKQKMDADLQREMIKGDYALKVAKENKNSHDSKSKK